MATLANMTTFSLQDSGLAYNESSDPDIGLARQAQTLPSAHKGMGVPAGRTGPAEAWSGCKHRPKIRGLVAGTEPRCVVWLQAQTIGLFVCKDMAWSG